MLCPPPLIYTCISTDVVTTCCGLCILPPLSGGNSDTPFSGYFFSVVNLCKKDRNHKYNTERICGFIICTMQVCVWTVHMHTRQTFVRVIFAESLHHEKHENLPPAKITRHTI